MTVEAWRPVAWAPDYEVSDLGRVRSYKYSTPRILRPCVNSFGYHNQTLYVDGAPVFTTAHALVLEAFVGPRPEGLVCRHLDGNPANNVLPNLRYGTYAENSQDMLAHGTNANRNKTHCPANHPYSEANTYVYRAERRCRSCMAVATKRSKAKSRAGRLESERVAS